jgi:hypothetical protein
MAKRTRRRTRSRNRRSQQLEGGYDFQALSSDSNLVSDGSNIASNHFLPSRASLSGGHWQSQWSAWQDRRLSGDASPFVSQHRARDSTSSIDSFASVASIWPMQHASRPSTASSSNEHSPIKISPPKHQRSVKSTADMSVVEHRLRMFGGEVDDGLALCEPMMSVVRKLFDGKLDYMDP